MLNNESFNYNYKYFEIASYLLNRYKKLIIKNNLIEFAPNTISNTKFKAVLSIFIEKKKKNGNRLKKLHIIFPYTYIIYNTFKAFTC